MCLLYFQTLPFGRADFSKPWQAPLVFLSVYESLQAPADHLQSEGADPS